MRLTERLMNISQRHVPVLVLVLLVGLHGVLAFRYMGVASLWFDEIFSVYMARLELGAYLELQWGREINAKLYYLALRAWVSLFGDGAVAVRSLSAVFSLALIPVIYALGRRLMSERAGLAAAALVSLNAFQLYYAQEARAYTLAVLLVSLASLLFLKAVEKPTPRLWILYALAAAASVYAHLFSALVLVAHFAALAMWGRPWGVWKHYLGSAAVIGAAVAPLAYGVATLPGALTDWLQKPDLASIYHLVQALIGHGRKYLMVPYTLAWVMVLRRLDAPARFLACWAGVPVTILFVASLVASPVFLDRYLIISLPAFVLLGVLGMERMRPRAAGVALFVLILVITATRLPHAFSTEKHQDWPAATTHVLAQRQPGDAIIFNLGATWLGFQHFAPDHGLDVIYPSPSRQADPLQVWSSHLFPLEKLDGLPHSRIWAVFSFTDSPRLGEGARQLESALAADYDAVSEYRSLGVRVILFERKAPAEVTNASPPPGAGQASQRTPPPPPPPAAAARR